jgi:hypothetical protein
MSLSKYSDDELRKELERREKVRSVPAPKPKPDFTNLILEAEEGIRSIVKEGHPGKDFEHYIFETAMQCIFGPDVWDWWNENCGE